MLCLKGIFGLSVGVIIPAAGRGKRMGTKVSKQFLPLGDKPVLIHTLMVFETHPEVDEIVVVAGAGEVSRVEEMVAQYGLEKSVQLRPVDKNGRIAYDQDWSICKPNGCWYTMPLVRLSLTGTSRSC